MVRAVLLGLVLTLFSAGVSAATPPLFRTLDGEFVTLDQYTGENHWLVVMVWASDCHVCNQEAHNYEALHQARKDNGLRMLGVSVDGWDGRGEAEGFVKRHKLGFPNLVISPDQMSMIMAGLSGSGLEGTPSFLVFDPAGMLRAQQVGAVPVAVIEDFVRRESASGG